MTKERIGQPLYRVDDSAVISGDLGDTAKLLSRDFKRELPTSLKWVKMDINGWNQV